MRRGSEATWQGRGWPTRGAGGAQGAATWQGATHPRESTWAPVWGAMWQVGLADGGPAGIVGLGKRVGAVTQLLYTCAPLFNRVFSQYFLRVGLCSHTFFCCRTCGSMGAVGSKRKASIAWTRVHAIGHQRTCLIGGVSGCDRARTS